MEMIFDKKGLENIIVGIYVQACKDYKYGMKKLLKKTHMIMEEREFLKSKYNMGKNAVAIRRAYEAKRFLIDDPYGFYSKIDGQAIIEQLNKDLFK